MNLDIICSRHLAASIADPGLSVSLRIHGWVSSFSRSLEEHTEILMFMHSIVPGLHYDGGSIVQMGVSNAQNGGCCHNKVSNKHSVYVLRDPVLMEIAL